MTPAAKAWMVRWILRGQGNDVPLDLLLAVPECAFDEQVEHDTYCTQFESQHPINAEWRLGITRNLDLDNTPPNVYEVWCYEEDYTKSDREFILVATQLCLETATEMVGWLARVNPADNVDELEHLSETLEPTGLKVIDVKKIDEAMQDWYIR